MSAPAGPGRSGALQSTGADLDDPHSTAGELNLVRQPHLVELDAEVVVEHGSESAGFVPVLCTRAPGAHNAQVLVARLPRQEVLHFSDFLGVEAFESDGEGRRGV